MWQSSQTSLKQCCCYYFSTEYYCPIETWQNIILLHEHHRNKVLTVIYLCIKGAIHMLSAWTFVLFIILISRPLKYQIHALHTYMKLVQMGCRTNNMSWCWGKTCQNKPVHEAVSRLPEHWKCWIFFAFYGFMSLCYNSSEVRYQYLLVLRKVLVP